MHWRAENESRQLASSDVVVGIRDHSVCEVEVKMKARQRRKWLGLAAQRVEGYLCLICLKLCRPVLTPVSLEDCKMFNPCMDWKDAANGLSERGAEMAYRQALTEHLAEMRAAEATKQAEWAELQRWKDAPKAALPY